MGALTYNTLSFRIDEYINIRLGFKGELSSKFMQNTNSSDF